MARIGQGGIALTGEDVAIEAAGLSLPAMLYRPPDAAPAGAVVLCPGGLGQGSFEIVEWLAGSLASVGLVGLTTSWRANSPEHDPDDIALAVDWLSRQAFVDAARIGVMGMSRGGNAALRAAAFDARIRACVTFGPATDFLQQVEGAALYAPGRHRMLVDWLGDPIADRAYYERVQAITHAAAIRQPVLMVHGQHDMHAVPEQSIWMKAAIEAGGNRDVELDLVPMMGHYGDVSPNGYGFDLLRARILPWLAQRLGG